MSALSRTAITGVFAAIAVTACSHPYSPTSTTASSISAPDLPRWSEQYSGKLVTSLGQPAHRCIGYLDVLSRYTGSVPGATILGWGCDSVMKKPVKYVLLTYADNVVIGAGKGGTMERDDVQERIPAVTSKMTGWRAVAHANGGTIGALEFIPHSSVCLLGKVDL